MLLFSNSVKNDNMADNVLYIIGNGFDLHHGVKSGYYSFSTWLKHYNPDLYKHLSRACKVEFLWSEFERALGYLSRREFLEQGEVLLPTNWDPDNDQMADLFMAEDIARNSGADFWEEVQLYFRKWVSLIKWYHRYDEQKIMLDTEARFITFNYTQFLETQYGISHEQILYIHGSSISKKYPPILGHDGSDHFEEDFKKLPKRLKSYYQGKRSYLPEVEMLTESAETFVSESEKPVKQIINQHKDFFEDLYDIEYVYILGHSMANVDLPYFKKVVECNDYPEKMHWLVSYYNEKDRDNFLQRVHRISYSGSTVEPIKLQNFLLKH